MLNEVKGYVNKSRAEKTRTHLETQKRGDMHFRLIQRVWSDWKWVVVVLANDSAAKQQGILFAHVHANVYVTDCDWFASELLGYCTTRTQAADIGAQMSAQGGWPEQKQSERASWRSQSAGGHEATDHNYQP